MAQRVTSEGTKKAAKSAKKGKRNGVSGAKEKGKAKDKGKNKAKKSGQKSGQKSGKKRKKKKRPSGDPQLFAPLSEGERADALRIMIEDRRLAPMAAVGRYRVIAVEPLVVKEPPEIAEHRLARVVAYDYSTDRSVHACVDLDQASVCDLQLGAIQPMLAREEEAAAIAIALADERIKSRLGLGDEPQAAMHYWSTRESDIPYRRRSAAVLFGQVGSRPSLVAVVDLLDGAVIEVVPADQW